MIRLQGRNSFRLTSSSTIINGVWTLEKSIFCTFAGSVEPIRVPPVTAALLIKISSFPSNSSIKASAMSVGQLGRVISAAKP